MAENSKFPDITATPFQLLSTSLIILGLLVCIFYIKTVAKLEGKNG